MKTNQMMHVDLGGFRLDIEHKTGLGNLTALWGYGNKLRARAGKSPLRLDHYLSSPETCEYLIEIEKIIRNGIDSKGKSNLPVSGDLESSENSSCTDLSVEYSKRGDTAKVVGKLTCIRTKRGKYGGTWANLYILIDAAMRLDPAFKARVVDTFIAGKILDYRDSSGDGYKALCAAMDKNCLAKNKWDYKTIAHAIALKTLGVRQSELWNTATKEQLAARDKLESNLLYGVSHGFITSLGQLLHEIEIS